MVTRLEYKGVQIYQTPEEIALLRETARSIKDIPGVVVEVGVYQGASAAILREELPDKELHLFDTFEGFADQLTEYDPKSYAIGTCAADESHVLNLIGGDNHVFIMKGVFPESGDILVGQKIALAHIDVDIYQASKDSLEFLFPLVVNGGKILVHDYPAHSGVKKAVDDFLKELPDGSVTSKVCGPRQILITKNE